MSTGQQHGNIPSTAVEFAPITDVEPGSPPIRHTHPGEEIIYVLEGSLEYQIDGQPTQVYNAGEALTVPAGVIHAVRNAGTGAGHRTRHRHSGKGQAAPHRGPVNARPGRRMAP